MGKVAEQVVVLLLMMLAGFITAKIKLITDEGRNLLTKLVLYISSPLLVIDSFQKQFDAVLLKNMGIVALFAMLSMAASYALGSRMWPRGDDGKRRVLWQATLFSNCGFMGYPVLMSLFPDTGVVYGSVYVMAFTLFTWTLGVYIYAGKSGNWREVLLQPGMIAVVIGLLFFLTSYQLPSWARQAVSGLGSLNTPLAMLIVGALVAEGDFKNVYKEWTLFAAAAVRLVALPGLALIALWLIWRLGLPGMPAVDSAVVSSCVLLTAMPVAANVAIFASMYSVRPQYAAQTVLVSTLLSVATIPMWIFVLHALAGVS